MANFLLLSIVLIMSFGIHDWMYVGGKEENEVHGFINKEVNLTCHLNSTGDAIWLYELENTEYKMFNCTSNQHGQCENTKTMTASGLLSLIATKNEAIQFDNISVLSLTPKVEFARIFKCMIGDDHTQNFRVISLNENNLTSNCAIELPGRDENGVNGVTLSCEVNSGELDVDMTLQGIGLDAQLGSSQNIKVIYFDKFNNIYNATCNAYFSDINLTRSCSFPNIIKAGYVPEGTDVIVNCNYSSDLETKWQFYNQNGIEEDIRNRSWSRKGGRSVLIRDISEQDEGKVVVCRTKGVNETNNGTIGFAVISNIPGDSSSPDSKTGGRTPTSGDQHNIFLVLTLLFLSLWVVTTIVGGVFYWVITKKTKSDTPIVATSSPSGYVSRASNGRSNEHETPLSSDGARGRRDPDTTNTNNSAHNPAFEPETISINGNRGNRQSNEGNHLYFTLEKSSPSPKTSTSRQERPGSSMNHPKGSQWQGYETVGDPNKGVFCSFDPGEYADISFQGKVTSDLSEYSEVDATHFRGTAPPGAGEYSEVRRSFRGKEQPTLPDRNSLNKIPKGEQVERDEISRLYGKVKK